MCEAPSAWRARVWRIPPWALIAEYSGLIAAPGRPKVSVAPSFSRMSTTASTARIRVIVLPLSSGDGSVASDAGGRAGPTVSLGRRPRRGPPDGGGSAPVLARELLDDDEQTRVVQTAVALLDRRCHALGDGRAYRDRYTGLAGGGVDDAHVLVVQLLAESGVDGAVEHLLPLLVDVVGAGESAAEHLERRGGLDSVGFEEDHGLGKQTVV